MREFKNPYKYQGGWVEWAALGVAAVGAVASIFGGGKAAKAAERAAEAERIAQSKITAEQVRNLHAEEAAVKGETLAATTGSGVSTESTSTLGNLAEQASEYHRERTITKEVGASRVAAALGGAKSVAAQAKWSSYSAALGGISTGLATYSAFKK